MVLRLAVCLFAVGSLSCGASPGVTQPTTTSTVAGLLAAGSWELRVDRVWAGAPGSVTYPTDELVESDFRPSPSPIKYSMIFSVQARTVSIGDSPKMTGTLASETDQRVTYSLNEGVFAGGRLVVWRAGQDLQGELTIYGSGLPIVRSERGKVVR
jgi:hypothetical protein